jgi:hypothetical protein
VVGTGVGWLVGALEGLAVVGFDVGFFVGGIVGTGTTP